VGDVEAHDAVERDVAGEGVGQENLAGIALPPEGRSQHADVDGCAAIAYEGDGHVIFVGEEALLTGGHGLGADDLASRRGQARV
jgi:hypothetical protein